MSISASVFLCAVFLISLCAIIIKQCLSRKRFLQKKEEARRLLEKISAFFADFSNLIGRYVSNKDENAFAEKWSGLFREAQRLKFGRKISGGEERERFLKTFSHLHEAIEETNRRFILRESQEHDALLSDIDGKSLDAQQREAVLCDEGNTLVLAGAGSGKTLTIAAKIKYLCDVKKVSPADILLISFTNKSAEEMTARIEKLGISIEAMTFHKLGLEIITKSRGRRPDVFDNLPSFARDFFERRLPQFPELVRLLTEYFAYYLEIPEAASDYDSLGALYEKEKTADLETIKSKYDRETYIAEAGEQNARLLKSLNGEYVKSLEETKIANFLFMNGVRYEYERLYPFESDDPLRKSYRPDFYLCDYDIYLEHFGVNKDFKCPHLSPVEEEKYVEGIKWKRDFHQRNGTKLLETYSYYTSDGVLLEKLKGILLENGVEFRPRDMTDIFETVYAKKSDKYFSQFIDLCCSFITLFKSSNYKAERLDEMKARAAQSENAFLRERTRLFITIVKIMLEEYQRYLSDNSQVDFSDMINAAAEEIRKGFLPHTYRYIIVDEYQDVSRARFALLKAVADTSGAKVFCVGDDWQSIYRFAGSDVSLFTDFEKYFGFTKTLRIEKTYRNSQNLIDEASRFVMKNPMQLQKKLTSDKSLGYPLVFWGYDDEPRIALGQIMRKIIAEFGAEKSVLFLGRTNYDISVLENSGLFRREQRGEKLVYLDSPETPVAFLSVHKSKGLEADNIVVLNFKNDRFGFPNQIADDRVLEYVLSSPEPYPFAEERRLFYVAITRTRNRTFVLTDNKNPSVFFKEFSESSSVCFVAIRKGGENDVLCPRCRTGTLLKIEHNGGSFVGCSNYPKCDYRLKNISVLSSPKKCPSCGGFLVRRKAPNGHGFAGCTNYPQCTYTEELRRE